LLRILTLILAALYTLAFVVWRLLLLTPLYDHFWQLRLSQVFTPWFYLPLLLLGLLILLTRQRVAAFLVLIPLVCFVGEYGRQFWLNGPGLATSHPASARVRVLTWNTHYTSDHDDAFQHTLAAVQPDLVALQEVSYFLRTKLARTLITQYPYQVVDNLSSTEALVVLSRYPVLHSDFDDGYRRGCRCQQVMLDLAGQPISLINTHMPSPRISINLYGRLPRIYRFDNQFQINTVEALLTRMVQTDEPLLLAGDLNLTEQQQTFQRLRTQVDDAFETAGWGMGFTFPQGRRLWRVALPPFVRIDHILYTQQWQAVMAQAGPPLDSDHLYVVADLVLRR
jgi:vancomycin resistance protein VanJ